METSSRIRSSSAGDEAGIDLPGRIRAEEEIFSIAGELAQRVQDLLSERRSSWPDSPRSDELALLQHLSAKFNHELRNPLGVIRTSSYVLRKGLQTSDPQMIFALERIERGVSRCDRIIDEILDFTQITEIEPEPKALDIWLAGVLVEQDLPAGVTLRPGFGLAGTTVQFDPDRLRRAVINVFDNACQAMADEDGAPEETGEHVLAVWTRRRGDRIEIVFKDEGPGIAPDVLPRIFEPLFSTRAFGVGLGLSVVRQIMEQHGGGIEVENNEDRGTQVCFWLPGESADTGVA